MKVSVRQGFLPEDRANVAALFWQAFKGKLNVLLGPDRRAIAFIENVLNPAFALSAYDGSGELLGVAGFKTDAGALVGGTYSDLSNHYGHFGAAWRGVLLELLERPVEPGELCMDGIFVSPHARGRGVGTALLSAICDEARERGLDTVRLDVIDTNPRAKALYERFGFMPHETSHTGILRPVFGFSSSVRMSLTL